MTISNQFVFVSNHVGFQNADDFENWSGSSTSLSPNTNEGEIKTISNNTRAVRQEPASSERYRKVQNVGERRKIREEKSQEIHAKTKKVKATQTAAQKFRQKEVEKRTNLEAEVKRLGEAKQAAQSAIYALQIENQQLIERQQFLRNFLQMALYNMPQSSQEGAIGQVTPMQMMPAQLAPAKTTPNPSYPFV